MTVATTSASSMGVTSWTKKSGRCFSYVLFLLCLILVMYILCMCCFTNIYLGVFLMGCFSGVVFYVLSFYVHPHKLYTFLIQNHR